MKKILAFLLIALLISGCESNSGNKSIDEGDVLKISNLHQLAPGKPMTVENVTKKTSFEVNHALSQLDIDILMAGGRLNYIKMGK